MNALTPTQQLSQYNGSSVLTIELGKMLGLVAPISMTADQQTLWLASAVDALQDIRPEEVITISAEVRRSVTRAAQIVPEIARLVAERREQNCRRMYVPDALPPLPPRPPASPLTRQELDTMKPQTVSLGLKYGFLERRSDGRLYETKAA